MIRPVALTLGMLVVTGSCMACSRVPIAAAPGETGRRPRSLPLAELRVPADRPGRAFAVVLTGDGPTGGRARRLAQELRRGGTPAVVWHSLRYYWRPRTPDEAARDLDGVIRHYAREWGRDRVVLVGYSMGADVLPFLVNRLPADTRARVAGLALAGMAADAVFEFRLEQWWGPSTAPRHPVLPELRRLMGGVPVTCLWGAGDRLAACTRLEGTPVRVVELRGGHHFKGDFGRLAAEVRAVAARAEAEGVPGPP
ncbi:MAG TPA: AcvB/VirJ family lysyl-phosphatidylglycerol hydrolase [Longimicrobium sp.]|nr:AcvB/VirJ family lysyl-phosphatidylglycerol hydrolase [Longimicrobium sp.]